MVLHSIYGAPFSLLQRPNLLIKKPAFIKAPSAMTVFGLAMASYFLVTGGIIYDVIVEPPSMGTTVDERGHQRPVAFMPYRINAQYIMEGLASSFLFGLGGMGFIILDRTNNPVTPKLNRIILLATAFFSISVSFFMLRVFMRMKLPGYLN